MSEKMDAATESLKQPEPEETRTPLAPGAVLQDGMYVIERLLGEGGFALAYLARQGRWGLSVCLKEYFPMGCQRRPDGIYPCSPQYEHRITEGLRGFSSEAASLARFNHPGIVRVLGAFSENLTVYLVQEVLEGMTLAHGLSLAGKMKEEPVLQVAQQVGQALLMVHGGGLVHADLKPANIFLTRRGRYVLLDFGLTRGFLSASTEKEDSRGLSHGFAPPEQYMREEKLTPTTDVYGLAATLFCLLTGAPPPDAQLRCQGQPLPKIQPLNPSISPKVERAIINALELDHRRRTPGIREFMHQLGVDSTPKGSYRPPQFTSKAHERAHPTGTTVLALHAPTQMLFSGGHDGGIRAWSWPDMKLLTSVTAHDRPVAALAVSRKGKYVVSSSESGEIKLWDAGLTLGHVLLDEGTPPARLTFDRKSDLIGATFGSGLVCLLSSKLPEPLRWMAHQGPVNSMDFHPTESYLVTAGSDQNIRFWAQPHPEAPEPEMFSELKGHEKAVQSAVFSPDGTNLLSASNDHSVIFWDLLTNQGIRELKGHQALVLEAQFTCQENLVVSLSGDHCLRGFQLDGGRVILCSEAHKNWARALVVDPTQPLAATAGADGICVWEFPARA